MFYPLKHSVCKRCRQWSDYKRVGGIEERERFIDIASKLRFEHKRSVGTADFGAMP